MGFKGLFHLNHNYPQLGHSDYGLFCFPVVMSQWALTGQVLGLPEVTHLFACGGAESDYFNVRCQQSS